MSHEGEGGDRLKEGRESVNQAPLRAATCEEDERVSAEKNSMVYVGCTDIQDLEKRREKKKVKEKIRYESRRRRTYTNCTSIASTHHTGKKEKERRAVEGRTGRCVRRPRVVRWLRKRVPSYSHYNMTPKSTTNVLQRSRACTCSYSCCCSSLCTCAISVSSPSVACGSSSCSVTPLWFSA